MLKFRIRLSGTSRQVRLPHPSVHRPRWSSEQHGTLPAYPPHALGMAVVASLFTEWAADSYSRCINALNTADRNEYYLLGTDK